MSADLVGVIERLLQQKEELLKQAAGIDAELERASLAIGGRLGVKPPHGKRGERAKTGTYANRILAVLEEREPRTSPEIAAHLSITTGYAQVLLREMAMKGVLHRAQRAVFGRPFVYARTKAALGVVVAVTDTSANGGGEEAADAEG